MSDGNCLAYLHDYYHAWSGKASAVEMLRENNISHELEGIATENLLEEVKPVREFVKERWDEERSEQVVITYPDIVRQCDELGVEYNLDRERIITEKDYAKVDELISKIRGLIYNEKLEGVLA